MFLFSCSLEGGARGDRSSRLDSRLIKFSVQRGARFDLKEEQLQEVFSKFGRLVRYRLYPRTNMGFDGFLGERGIFVNNIMSRIFTQSTPLRRWLADWSTPWSRSGTASSTVLCPGRVSPLSLCLTRYCWSQGQSRPSFLNTKSTGYYSRYLPNVWERDMILRSFFSKYGVVTGVSMIGYTPGKLLRYVVSFKVRLSLARLRRGIAALTVFSRF